MKHLGVIVAALILSPALYVPVFAQEAVPPEVTPPENTPANPVEVKVETPPEIKSAEPPAEAVKQEPIAEQVPEAKPSSETLPKPLKGSGPMDRPERHDNDNRHDREDGRDDKKRQDWKKNNEKRSDWKKHKEHSSRPRVVYRRAPPKIIYIYPQSYYPPQSYTEIYTNYPADYEPSFHVGGYLPPERQWRPLPDFARYGLPAPRQGETWFYNDRDAVLINDETSRIVSAFVLAAAID